MKREIEMKTKLLQCCLAGLMLSLPLAASAKMDDAQARADVNIMLGEGNTAAEVVDALVADGREWVDACVLATSAVEVPRRMEIVDTCIGSSTSIAQAKAVADALTALAGDNLAFAGAIAQVMALYSTETLIPPTTYQGDGIATGGGSVSPAL